MPTRPRWLPWALSGAIVAAAPLWPQAALAQPPVPPVTETARLSEDPAVVQFETEVGLLLVPVAAATTADYEAMIRALQAALAASPDPARRTQAAGWRVYKASEPDAKGQALYVHLISPVVPGVDYRPSAVLDALVDGAPEELLVKYRNAHAGPPSKLSLVEIANMTLAPAAPPAGVKPPGGR
ncbi:MAG: hypothetical protein Q8L86_17515 [Vicinamibacterales bacterium]|nr:hypothetical protein [Vicinamibacterales bacterium]